MYFTNEKKHVWKETTDIPELANMLGDLAFNMRNTKMCHQNITFNTVTTNS